MPDLPADPIPHKTALKLDVVLTALNSRVAERARSHPQGWLNTMST